MHREVCKSRSKDDKKHLPKDAKATSENEHLKCLTDPYPFCCPCVPNSSSSKLRPKPGPHLILAPLILLPTWKDQWAQNIDDQHRTKMKLLVQHGNIIHRENYATEDDISRIRSGYIEDRVVPQIGSESYVVLTTSQSFGVHVKKLFSRNKDNWVEDSVVWGHIIKDECHTEKNPENNAPLHIRTIMKKASAKPYLWPVSGTPTTNSPKDLLAYMALLEREWWKDDVNFKKFLTTEIVDMASQMDKYVKAADSSIDDMKLVIEWYNALLKQFMIRRTGDSRWFNDDLVKLPPHIHEDVDVPVVPEYEKIVEQCKTDIVEAANEAYTKAKRAWEKGGQRTPEPKPKPPAENLTHRARMVTDIPGLAILAKRYDMALTFEEIAKNGWLTNEEESPYAKNLDMLFKSSGKLQYLEKLVRGRGTGKDGRKHRMLVVSFTPVIAFIVNIVSQPDRILLL